MNTTFKRIAVLCIILVASIALGFLTDLVWSGIEKTTHPDSYEQYVEKYSYEYNVPSSVIFAIIKVESDFDPQAESGVGARGLMQMMPSTFEWLTSDEHLGEYLHKDELFEPEISIKYGTYYFSYLYEKFDRNIDTALAAYNGGEGNVAKWLDDPEYSDGNGNITDFPEKFSETENYVKAIARERKNYQELYFEK